MISCTISDSHAPNFNSRFITPESPHFKRNPLTSYPRSTRTRDQHDVYLRELNRIVPETETTISISETKTLLNYQQYQQHIAKI